MCLSPLLLAAVLAACATPSPTGLPGSAVFACEDGTTLNVRFVQDAAYVTPSGGTELLLPQERAASGISYRTAQHEFRGKGEEMMWAVGRRTPIICRLPRCDEVAQLPFPRTAGLEDAVGWLQRSLSQGS